MIGGEDGVEPGLFRLDGEIGQLDRPELLGRSLVPQAQWHEFSSVRRLCGLLYGHRPALSARIISDRAAQVGHSCTMCRKHCDFSRAGLVTHGQEMGF
jgi:hypothetical protein